MPSIRRKNRDSKRTMRQRGGAPVDTSKLKDAMTKVVESYNKKNSDGTPGTVDTNAINATMQAAIDVFTAIAQEPAATKEPTGFNFKERAIATYNSSTLGDRFQKAVKSTFSSSTKDLFEKLRSEYMSAKALIDNNPAIQNTQLKLAQVNNNLKAKMGTLINALYSAVDRAHKKIDDPGIKNKLLELKKNIAQQQQQINGRFGVGIGAVALQDNNARVTALKEVIANVDKFYDIIPGEQSLISDKDQSLISDKDQSLDVEVIDNSSHGGSVESQVSNITSESTEPQPRQKFFGLFGGKPGGKPRKSKKSAKKSKKSKGKSMKRR